MIESPNRISDIGALDIQVLVADAAKCKECFPHSACDTHSSVIESVLSCEIRRNNRPPLITRAIASSELEKRWVSYFGHWSGPVQEAR